MMPPGRVATRRQEAALVLVPRDRPRGRRRTGRGSGGGRAGVDHPGPRPAPRGQPPGRRPRSRSGPSRRRGPATIAVLDGVVRVGLGPPSWTGCATSTDIAKLSVRDVGSPWRSAAAARPRWPRRRALAHRRRHRGVRHRRARRGAPRGRRQLRRLGRPRRAGPHPGVVVCAGVKSILDVPAHPGVPGDAVGAGDRLPHRRFPGFYLSDSGEPVTWRVDTPEQAAAIVLARRELATDRAGVVLANPLPPDRQLDPDLHDAPWPPGWRCCGRGRHRQGRHAAAAGVLPRRHPRREPAGERRTGAGQRRAGRPGGGRGGRPAHRPWTRSAQAGDPPACHGRRRRRSGRGRQAGRPGRLRPRHQGPGDRHPRRGGRKHRGLARPARPRRLADRQGRRRRGGRTAPRS